MIHSSIEDKIYIFCKVGNKHCIKQGKYWCENVKENSTLLNCSDKNILQPSYFVSIFHHKNLLCPFKIGKSEATVCAYIMYMGMII